MDHLNGRHCSAAMRSLPQEVLLDTFKAFASKKSCELEKEEGSASRGVLLVRGALTDEVAELAYDYWVKWMHGNASGTVQPGRFSGRTIWRGGGAPLPSQLVDALHSLLEGWHSRGLLPAVWPRVDAAAASAAIGTESGGLPPELQDTAEFIELNSRTQHAECHDFAWPLCATDWHVDGGLRGYKLWSILKRERHLNTTFRWNRTGIDPRRSNAKDHGNLIVAPTSNVRALCELAFEINRTRVAAETMETTARLEEEDATGHDDRPMTGLGQLVSQASQCITSGLASILNRCAAGEVFSQLRDDLALEVAGCHVRAEVGDVLLLHPDVFHRLRILR